MAQGGYRVEPGFSRGCLRALREGDVPGMLEWMRDPDVSGVFQSDFSSMDEGAALSFVQTAATFGSSLHFAISDEGGEYMGTVSLKNVDPVNLAAEYAIATRACAHGTGLAMDATMEVLRYAFADLGLHRVYLCVRSDNGRARRFYGKVGFRREGTARDAVISGDGFVDLEWYSVLAGDTLGDGAA